MHGSYNGRRGNFNYVIEPEQIEPMANGLEWAAKVVAVTHLWHEGMRQGMTQLEIATLPLHEHWGETESAAVRDCVQELQEWIDSPEE